MGKYLVIVESPAKAKTINKYLGKDFIVKSSVGHIRDLPTGGKRSAPTEGRKTAAEVRKMTAEDKARYQRDKEYRQLVSSMGLDPEHGWQAQYEVLPGKERVVKELKDYARSAETVYLATDLDREGEAIAWHLREVIGGDDSKFRRVVFNEITKNAITQAFSAPGELDIARVDAQQARRFLDRVVGYMVSPLLWKKVARGLSAGRVQSVAVRLIVEREREIRAFKPEEYWSLHAALQGSVGEPVDFELVKSKGQELKIANQAQAKAIEAELQSASFVLVRREDKPTQSKAAAPFITSTLQQAASTRLGFGVKKTMTLAQMLYEAGFITYMRTDSTNLSEEALVSCRAYIEQKFGPAYLPDAPVHYGNRDGAQEAHEAIRPSNVELEPAAISLDADARRLYELIWRQFLACQMTAARYDATSLTAMAQDYELRARGRVLKFDGWTRVLPQQGKKPEDLLLPAIHQGESLALQDLLSEQHFTKPPARFTEASLVKELEKRGIGRPSTYAAIISTIQDRGYAKVDNKRFFSEKMGDIVTDRLVENFKELLDYGFTAAMEDKLDAIAKGETPWRQVLDRFYADFKLQLHKAESEPGLGGMRANQPTLTDIPCPTCNRPMAIRTASTGVFLGCSGYSLPEPEQCKQTLNLTPGDEVVADDEDAETRALRAKRRCPKCSTAMEPYLLDADRRLHICGNNPDCDGFEVERGNFRIKGYDGPLLECDKCGADMQLKTGRFGKYFGCTNTGCKNTRKLLRSGEAAPPKSEPIAMPHLKCLKSDAYFVLRDGAAGLFLAANTFPKSRETRAPLLKELLSVKDQLDAKYQFLLSGPLTDDQGNPSQVRFSRKTKEQYLMTEKDGKATGWSSHYQQGKWHSKTGKA